MVATILTIFLSKNGILNSTFFVLDSTIWLDSTLKIDPASRPKTTKTTKSLPARDSPYKLLYNGWYMSPSNMPLLVGDLSPTWFLGLTQVSAQTGSWSVYPFSRSPLHCVSNTHAHADHATSDIGSNSPHLRSAGNAA